MPSNCGHVSIAFFSRSRFVYNIVVLLRTVPALRARHTVQDSPTELLAALSALQLVRAGVFAPTAANSNFFRKPTHKIWCAVKDLNPRPPSLATRQIGRAHV